MKTDYYELLEVESSASETTLKKAFRRKALEWHPDKNPDRIEEATKTFNSIRGAYEVLSDPQERAWYDSHKHQILMEDEDISFTQSDQVPVYAGMSVEEILGFSTVDLNETSFFRVVSDFFAKLSAEEVGAGLAQDLEGFSRYMDNTAQAGASSGENLLYPRFGNGKSDFGSEVRIFYSHWSSFQSVKTFSWFDEYRYSTAPDRRTRRLMEKENKRSRESARKAYNEAVRSLVAIIKKRDGRVKEGAKLYEQERRRKQQSELKMQQARDREANRAQREKFELQEWQKVDTDELAEIEEALAKLHQESSEEEEEEEELYECFVCNKDFRSRNHFENHEKTNKHKKLVKRLQWEMRMEGIKLGIDGEGFVGEDENGFETASEGEMHSDLSHSDLKDLDVDAGDVDVDELGLDKLNQEELDNLDDLDEEELDNLDDLDEEELDDLDEEELDAEELNDLDGDLIENLDDLHDAEVDFVEDLDGDLDEPLIEPTVLQIDHADPLREVDQVDDFHDLDDVDHVNLSNLTLEESTDKQVPFQKKPKKKSKKQKKQKPSGIFCQICNETFSSRNKLFSHIGTSGHATLKSGANPKR